MQYDLAVAEITAFVLAGGKSSRMGQDKALLLFRGETLLQHALRIVSEITRDVSIVGARERYQAFGSVIEDVYRDCGPLAGIHAALTCSTAELNLMLSVDMPLMTSQFLRWLVAQAGATRELITVPEADGGVQPLCGVYRLAARDVVEQTLQAGEYKIARLFSQVPTRILTEKEIVANGFSATIFRNVNTQEEFRLVTEEGTADARGK